MFHDPGETDVVGHVGAIAGCNTMHVSGRPRRGGDRSGTCSSLNSTAVFEAKPLGTTLATDRDDAIATRNAAAETEGAGACLQPGC